MHRDTTRALEIVNKLAPRLPVEATPELNELRTILTDMDARTGTRDPSKRRAPKAAKKGAKGKRGRKLGDGDGSGYIVAVGDGDDSGYIVAGGGEGGDEGSGR